SRVQMEAGSVLLSQPGLSGRDHDGLPRPRAEVRRCAAGRGRSHRVPTDAFVSGAGDGPLRRDSRWQDDRLGFVAGGKSPQLRVERRFSWIIHELEDVILSEAPAKTFRPASFAGRVGAQSKDPYSCKKSKFGRMAQQTSPKLLGGERVPSTPRSPRRPPRSG